MMPRAINTRLWLSSLLATVACAPLAWGAPARTGLGSLSDDVVEVELANDGMTKVLDRAIVVDHVSPENQQSLRAALALRQLGEPNLNDVQRQALIAQITQRLSSVLPAINDAQMLLRDGSLLVEQAVKPDVYMLEWFGEDDADATKARLRPAIDTVIAIYDRAIAILDDRQKQLQSKIKSPDDPVADQWQKSFDSYRGVLYTRTMLVHSQVLALDRADKNRSALAAQAIKTLKEWDDPDNQVQAIVRLQMAKLDIDQVKPNNLRDARERLADFFVAPDSTRAIKPAPTPDQIFQARYYTALSFLIQRDVKSTESALDAADAYRKSALPDAKVDDWMLATLGYRLQTLQGDNAGAIHTLQDLSARAPELRGTIARLLLQQLPTTPDVKALNPLVLFALVEHGWNAVQQGNPQDASVTRGLSAAREYLSRADAHAADVTQNQTQYVSKAIGVLLGAQGSHAEAAAAFIDYAQKYKTAANSQADAALNQAISEVQLQEKADALAGHQSDTDALESRILPVAVNDFHRYDLAYDYARRLQKNGQSAAAIKAFSLVPDSDPNALSARYLKMVAMKQQLGDQGERLSAAERTAEVHELQALTDQVAQEIAGRQPSETAPARKTQLAAMLASTQLLAADTAREDGNDPARCLALLEGFEATVSALPAEQARRLTAQALDTRYLAYMATGDTARATDALLQYLKNVTGLEGLQKVHDLLTVLNKELDAAQAAHDQEQVRKIAGNRAALTPFLVKWAAENTNPDIAKYTYRYRVFDAATQRLAASLITDPAQRRDHLMQTLANYRALQSPENAALYRASLPPETPDANRDYPDPQVTLGIGQIAFDLKDYQTVHQTIGQLIADAKLGDGSVVTLDAAGQRVVTDNEQFWEAQYQFIKATAELSKEPQSGVKANTARAVLDRLFVAWQEHTGGEKYHQAFVDLAAQLGLDILQPSTQSSL